ncbi:MAG: hypothetical protein JRN52_15685 [Nitrososphaerota archaeon]|nr:hypothetical protein [Nitrososphaerota archaeon]
MDQKPREAFLSSLDRALDTFGTSVRAVVYYELKKSFGVSREEIPLKPDLFANTIDNLFGVGVATVRHVILRELEASSQIKDLHKKDLVTAMRAAYHKRLEEMT